MAHLERSSHDAPTVEPVAAVRMEPVSKSVAGRPVSTWTLLFGSKIRFQISGLGVALASLTERSENAVLDVPDLKVVIHFQGHVVELRAYLAWLKPKSSTNPCRPLSPWLVR